MEKIEEENLGNRLILLEKVLYLHCNVVFITLKYIKMIQEIVKNYEHLKKSIPSLIESSGYRNDFIASKMQMDASYFAVKKKRSSWNDNEMEKLAKILDNEDVAAAYEVLLIKESKTGKALSSEAFEKEMKW
jgi:hypothetical protein